MTNKIKGLTKNEQKAISAFETSLIGRFSGRIKKLILFGSKARGDSHRNSDIDLLVLLDKGDKRLEQEIVGLTHEPIARFGVDLSPIIANEREFKYWSPFFERVKKEGITLWKNG